jgi:hypothetical protein
MPNNQTSLSLRAHLESVTAALAKCDASDPSTFGEVHSRLNRLKAQLEREQVLDQVAPVTIAVKLADQIVREGSVDASIARTLIDYVVSNTCDRLDVLKPASAPSLTATESGQTGGLKMLSSRKLGEIMVQLAMLDTTQIEKALAHQRAKGCRFGDALIELGLVSKDAVQTALRVQSMGKDQKRDPWKRTG